MINKKGVASIRIEYDQGDIKVFHGDHDVVLASWKEPNDVNDHWDIFWNLILFSAILLQIIASRILLIVGIRSQQKEA